MFTAFDTTSTPIPETAFIGRKTYLASLRRELCADKDARISYCGLLKTGKTSIMARFQEQVNRESFTTPRGYRCVVVYYPLYILTASLFVVLTERIDETLSAQKIECSEDVSSLLDQVSAAENKRDQARQMSKYVNALYDNYGIRVILVLDELQCAPESKVLSFADFALLHNMQNISIAYVGRLCFDKTMNDLSPSVWKSQLPCEQKVVLGFDENDMQEYCSIFYDMYGYDITWLLNDLEYYCGRSPHLLAYFGNKMFEKLEYNSPGSINRDWLKTIYNSLVSLKYPDEVENQLSLDTDGDMTNLERLRRIAVGPQIGIQEWDLALMRQMGYITDTDRASYAISLVFQERLAMMPISGELPLKIVTAETYLRHLIHKKMPAICMEHKFSEPLQTVIEKKKTCQWTDIDRTILNLELKRIPDNVLEKDKIDRPYKLYNPNNLESPHKKYALWVTTKQVTMPEANIEEVLLLKDRLGLIIGYWRYFSDFFEGGNREVWKQKFYLMCVARNPALHAGTLTKQEQIDCERTCDDIIRSLGNLEMTQEE